jgi:hypothetical protein
MDWGIEVLANDAVSDWSVELDPDRGYGQLREALNEVGTDVDAPTGQRAVAAAAIVALSRGVEYYVTLEVRAFLSGVGDPASDEDARQAAAALRVLVREPNELRDLWEEASFADEWEKHIADLIAGLEKPSVELPEWFEAPAELEPPARQQLSSEAIIPSSGTAATQGAPWWRDQRMTGTWDVDGFSNDDAVEWIARLDPARGYSQLNAALDEVRPDVTAVVGDGRWPRVGSSRPHAAGSTGRLA